MTVLQIALALLSGGAVGLSLGLIGGGGSILAVPLMVYVVGVSSPHVAIGTSAVAVSINALLGLAGHARERTVKWPCAIVFAAFGIAGAALGAEFGKAVDGHKLLAGFGLLMIVIAGLMARPRRGGDDPEVHLDPRSARRLLPPLAGTGFGAGALSGFFGIGGGFLIVPGLVTATSMPLLNAIGSSLVSVAAFGATTALSYAASGLVNWSVALLFIAGGAAGGITGMRLARRMAGSRRQLTLVFSGVVALVGPMCWCWVSFGKISEAAGVGRCGTHARDESHQRRAKSEDRPRHGKFRRADILSRSGLSISLIDIKFIDTPVRQYWRGFTARRFSVRAERLGLLAMLVFAIAGNAWAQSGTMLALDRPTKIDGIEVVCTGVGLDARENPLWAGYPLKIEVAGRGGQYLGDVRLTLSKDDKPVTALTCGGPWILFQVPPGRYRVEARIEDKAVSSAASVPDSGQGRIILRFPGLGGEIGKPEQPAPNPQQ